MTRLLHLNHVQLTSRLGDVIFVHGLNGDPVKSWSTGTPDGYWPQWLAEDLPNVQVTSAGYDIAASAWQGTAMPLFDRANNVLAALAADDIGARPIWFIAHSMGGLLVKQMLRNATTLAPEFEFIAKQVHGVVFVATPHTGSDATKLATYLSFFLRPTVAIRELQPHAAPLRDLNIWYRQNSRSLSINTQVYFETQKTNGIWLVDAATADPGIEGATPIPLDADHNSIVKLSGRNEIIYHRTRKFIEGSLEVRGAAGTEYNLVSQPPDPARIGELIEALSVAFPTRRKIETLLAEALKIRLTPELSDSRVIFEFVIKYCEEQGGEYLAWLINQAVRLQPRAHMLTTLRAILVDDGTIPNITAMGKPEETKAERLNETIPGGRFLDLDRGEYVDANGNSVDPPKRHPILLPTLDVMHPPDSEQRDSISDSLPSRPPANVTPPTAPSTSSPLSPRKVGSNHPIVLSIFLIAALAIIIASIAYFWNTSHPGAQPNLPRTTAVPSVSSTTTTIAAISTAQEILLLPSVTAAATNISIPPGLVVFTSDLSGDTGLNGMQADGSQVQPLTPLGLRAERAACSPDGLSVAFVGTRGVWTDIYTMYSTGINGTTNPKHLTNDPALDLRPAWSVDGKRIAFASKRSGSFEI